MNANIDNIIDSKPVVGLPPAGTGTLQLLCAAASAAASLAPASTSAFASAAAPAAVASSSSAYASAAAAASTSYSMSANVTFSDDDDDDDDDAMPWERYNWVPLQKCGKQKTPNMIRNELQRYIDQCKADGTTTQTRIIEQMGVNNNSFRRFMNPATYKDKWSAVDNGTYWAAAKLLARLAHEREVAKQSSSSGKRKATTTTTTKAADGTAATATTEKATKKAKTSGDESQAPRKKSSADLKLEAMQLIDRINAVGGVPENIVYDTCPQVVAKIKEFLQRDGMTKANLLAALGDLNSNSLNKFLSGKKQDQCGNITYKAAYVFFEKLRILEGKKKSAARIKNEAEHPNGFDLVKERPGKYFIGFW